MTRTRLILTLAAVLLGSTAASAQTVNLAWDASTDGSVTGYVVKWGTRSGTYTSSIDVGNRTSWSVGGLTVDQNYYFSVVAYNAAGMSAPSNEVSNNGLIFQTGGTLTDQRPSVFWLNGATGQVDTWHMSGSNVIDTRAVNLSVGDLHWKIVGTGDLNGDGYTDLVWRHDTAGWLAYWLLQSNQVVGTGYLSINQLADLNWTIRGMGDVNGDGNADLIWQHTDGSIAVWMMRGPTVLSRQLFSVPRVDPAWRIAAVADFNGDGMEDLVFQHSSGWLAVWLLQGSTVVAKNFLSINQITDTNWRIQAAGDTDGSGMPRIIWRHQTEGWVAVWTVNGFTVTGTGYINPNRVDNLNWQIVGVR